MVALNKVCTPKQWKTISVKQLLSFGYPVYGANGKIGFYDKYTHEKSTLMITCRGATCGNLHISEPKSYINGNAMALDNLDERKVFINYLYYYLLKREFKDVISGSAQPQITRQGLEKIEIPLPPLAEQKRIAAILDKADNIRRKREQAIKLADDFLKATFLEMFGDPIENPNNWEKKQIKTGILDIISGWSAVGKNTPCQTHEIGVLKISSVTSGTFKPQENKVVEKASIPKSKKLILPKKGDLIFSRANTRELVAAICLINHDYNNLFLPDKLWSIKINNQKILPEFFVSLIQNEKIRELLTKQATGTSGSMLNISKAKFESTEVIFPPITIQRKYADIFKKYTEWKEKINQSYYIKNELFNSLNTRVF